MSGERGKKNRTDRKRKREQLVADKMIHLYCKNHHKEYDRHLGRLCIQCNELSEYVKMRSERCPFMEKKTFCSNCRVHCYKPDMQDKIKRVMRFSGPRMLFCHPVLAIWHLICSMREIKKKSGETV